MKNSGLAREVLPTFFRKRNLKLTKNKKGKSRSFCLLMFNCAFLKLFEGAETFLKKFPQKTHR